ncbi:isochorismatase family protein [Dongia sp.]|uniref:isochorismatase family protein n=1 Tax=Dongia sp. TaxID=1977262 RepID=UPI003751D3F9
MTDRDDIYKAQGFNGSLKLCSRIGLLVIDFINGFADPAVFGGGNIASAISATQPILAYARAKRWPIAHTRIVFAEDGSDANIFCEKVPGMLRLTENARESALVPELRAARGEFVVRKSTPSAFANTGLAAWLTLKGVQTLAVCGCVTSGCVRATVVDAMQLGLRPFVLSDCVGDRALAPHEANLFDMQQKYAEVLTAAEFLTRVENLGSSEQNPSE